MGGLASTIGTNGDGHPLWTLRKRGMTSCGPPSAPEGMQQAFQDTALEGLRSLFLPFLPCVTLASPVSSLGWGQLFVKDGLGEVTHCPFQL